jgi:hypothetical protein
MGGGNPRGDQEAPLNPSFGDHGGTIRRDPFPGMFLQMAHSYFRGM